MDKRWLIKRLKTMSLGEVSYRARKTLRFRLLKSVLQKGQYRTAPKIELSLDFLPDFSTIEFHQWDRDDFDRVIREIMKDQLRIFEQEIDLSICKDWVTDPISGMQWSLDYFQNINYRNPDCPGDPKVIWEINRHQFLVLLGIAYRKERNHAFAEKIVNTISEWIDCNPLYRGINWVSSLELAIRMTSWAFALSLIKDSKALTKPVCDKIAQSVFQQVEFIVHYLSLYSSSNNHLIGELTGLIVGSYLISGSSQALKWKVKAVALLEEQVGKQFHSDGVNKEQSVFYQCYTMEYYLLCDFLLKRNGGTFKESVYTILRSACGFLADISTRSGYYPNLGDEDGGVGLLADVQENKVLSILSFATVLLGGNWLQNKDRLMDSRCLLLFGEEYTKVARRVESDVSNHVSNDVSNNVTKQEQLRVYPEGGYAILRDSTSEDEETMVTFDFGPIGKGPISAHGHADLLSIQLLYENIPFIVDTGTYKYFFSADFRGYFKGTMAHNTIAVDYDNQLSDYGMFLWGDHPRVTFQLGEPGENLFIEAEHEGYLDRYGVKHRRRIEWKEKVLTLYDTIYSSRRNNIQQFFHLHPDVQVEIRPDNLYVLTSGEKSISIWIDPKLIPVIKRGQEKPFKLGWFSPSFYSLRTTSTIESTKTVQGEMSFVTRIHLNP